MNSKKLLLAESTILLYESNDKIPVTTKERECIKDRFGEVGCSFAKDKKSGKYFCYTHRARSKFYDSLEKIPKSVVKFISSTS
jgi:hypothetical protein